MTGVLLKVGIDITQSSEYPWNSVQCNCRSCDSTGITAV